MKIKELKKNYAKEERRHDKAYEKENAKHEKRHSIEEEQAIAAGKALKTKKKKKR